MGLIPTASAKSLMVERGFFSKVCKILSRVDFILESITKSRKPVNILDNYHKYPKRSGSFLELVYGIINVNGIDHVLQFPALSFAETRQ